MWHCKIQKQQLCPEQEQNGSVDGLADCWLEDGDGRQGINDQFREAINGILKFVNQNTETAVHLTIEMSFT